MSLRLAGYVIIGSSTPSEDPVTVGYVWMDSGTNKLKICTAVSPYTWVEVTGAGGASAWGAITGTLSDQTDLQTALNAKAALVHTHAEADVTGLVADLALKAPLASPALTGTPTAPTAAVGTNTTQVATTAYVRAAPIDTLGVPTDIATLNASIAAHGLMQKYPNTTYEWLRGDGLFASALSRDAAHSWMFTTFAGDPSISLTRAQGTAAAPLRTKNTNSLGAFSAGGYNAADDVSVASANTFPSGWITITATADHTAASQPGKIVFLTTPVGSAVPLSRWTIGSDGALTPTGSNGSLAVKLDALLAPDDNTTLNATTLAHGLLPKLSGSSSQFLNGAGNFAAASALNSFALTTKVLSPATGNLTISANHSAVAVRQLTILSGRILTVASGSILRIL